MTAPEQRCSDCWSTVADYWADSVWLAEAGEPSSNPEIVVDQSAARMWIEIGMIHGGDR